MRGAQRRPGSLVFAGLCCTHYGYVASRISAELAGVLGRPVRTLDPNVRMVLDVMAGPDGAGGRVRQPSTCRRSR